MPFTPSACFHASSFSVFRRSLMQNDELPLTDAITDERFESVFQEHGIDFGDDEDVVYTPAITLWALVSQVFFSAEQRSCKAAVARVASLWAALGRRVCDANTGAYCRARLKISSEAVRDITKQLANDAEATVDQDAISEEDAEATLSPEVVAQVRSKSITGRILLLDGFTITAADTPENQSEYPQPSNQPDGLGFPILRCVTLISMVTGLLFDLACGPYSGKQTGEGALMRTLLDELQPGDTLVADSYHCNYALIAACILRGVGIVMKNGFRPDHPTNARKISKKERLVVWTRPGRRPWMTKEEYEQLPEAIELRLVDVQVRQKGFRPDSFTVATTIMDRKVYSAGWIRSVYQSRWIVELDIRSIKCSLGMDILRPRAQRWCGLSYGRAY